MSGSRPPSTKKRKMNPDVSDERYRGFLKGYSNEDSYGFIANPELKANEPRCFRREIPWILKRI